MSVALQILFMAIAFLPCLWLALLVLSWRDARRRLPVDPVAVPADRPPGGRLPRRFFWVLPLYWFIFFLVWPAILGSRLGRPRRSP